MTKLVAITIILVAASAVVGLRVEARDSDEVAPGLVTQELRVGGMQTPLCEMGVKRVLESLEGVAAVSVDRKHSRAEVTYDPALVSPVALARAVSAVGFSASLRGAESVAGPKAMAAHRVDRKPLTADEVDRVVTWVAAHVLDEGEIPTGSEIIEATGVQLVVADTPMIQQAVLMKLAEDPRGQALLEGSRCNDYGACSFWGNLAGASGETLAMYEEDRAGDGATFNDFPLPSFEALDLSGAPVRSEELVGRPAVIAFLAVHCTHSMEMFPVLQELHRQYGAEGLQVVGVLVNSGSAEDARGWVPQFSPEYPIWIHEGAALGDQLASRLVPTILLVDAEGMVRKKLVGFKDQETVLAEAELIREAA